MHFRKPFLWTGIMMGCFVGILVFCGAAGAAEKKKKPTLPPATPKPVHAQDVNRRTPLNKTTDFIVTLGQDSNQKRDTLLERKETRRMYRLEKQRKKKDALAKKRMRRQQKELAKQIKAEQKARYNRYYKK